MTDQNDAIAAAWARHRSELAHKFMLEYVNRIDVCGAYKRMDRREVVQRPDGSTYVDKVWTWPAKDKRNGFIVLGESILKRHFEGRDGNIRGLHSTSESNTCKWGGLDIDAHEGQQADPDANWRAARTAYEICVSYGLAVLLTDSNGRGGYHLLIPFAQPIPAARMYAFLRYLVKQIGEPTVHIETFPKQATLSTKKKYGNWLRLPGHHHTYDHWSRVWDGEQWLAGEPAVKSILELQLNAVSILEGIEIPEPPPAPAPVTRPQPPRRNGDGLLSNEEVVLECLKLLDPSMPYDDWIKVGQACHSVSTGGDMLNAWIHWSQGSSKFTPGLCEEKWETFDAAGRVKLGTLVKMARVHDANLLKPGSRRGRGTTSNPCTKPAQLAAAPSNYGDEQPYMRIAPDSLHDDEIIDVPPTPPPDADGGQDQPRRSYGVLTDYGNAQRLVRRHGDDLRFDGSQGCWLAWDGSRWVKDGSGEAMRRAKESARSMWKEFAQCDDDVKRDKLLKHAKKSEQRGSLEAALKLAQSEPSVAISATSLDRDTMLYNVPNGTIDLRTGELRAHRREDLITKIAPVAFDPDAKCPLWDRFLNRIMDGNADLIAYLQQIMGISLTGDISVQELWIFYGPGGNGKNVFLDTTMGLMGDYAADAPDSLMTTRTHDEHPTEVADLFGKRLIVGSETEEGAKLRLQLIKRLTGNKTLKARYMRQDYFSFQRSHKLILVTNNKPQVRESTNAVWRRLRLVPFTVVIPEEEKDPRLTEKLEAEWPGILAWAVRGCLDWQERGLVTPSEVRIATSEYQLEQDVLSEFLAARCICIESVKVERTALFQSYQGWCKTTGERDPLEKQAFYDRIRRLPNVSEGTARINGAPKHVFIGIGECAGGQNVAP